MRGLLYKMPRLKAKEIVLAATMAGVSLAWAAFERSGLALMFGGLLALLLCLLAAIDFFRMVLPNILNCLLAGGGLASVAILEQERLIEAVIAMAGGFALLAMIATLYRRHRGRPGLGLGDAKLFGALGPWIGIWGMPSVLLLAALSGLLFAFGRSVVLGRTTLAQRLPFGPFIALAGWVVWLYGPVT